MEKTSDVSGKTYAPRFIINISEFDRATAEIQVNFYTNSQLVLKYKKGGGAGMDGDIEMTLDPESNIFRVIPTPTQALKIKSGAFWVELKLAFAHSEYPDGRVECIKVKAKDVTQFNTVFSI
jgi:hypothetical protein